MKTPLMTPYYPSYSPCTTPPPLNLTRFLGLFEARIVNVGAQRSQCATQFPKKPPKPQNP